MADENSVPDYELERQIGHLLRKANQRHTGIFADRMPDGLTPTRFAAMAKLYEIGSASQNELGRLTAMDVATIKGVVDRLRARDLVEIGKDSGDARRHLVKLTAKGAELIENAIPKAINVTEQTTAPLTAQEARTLQELLARIS